MMSDALPPDARLAPAASPSAHPASAGGAFLASPWWLLGLLPIFLTGLTLPLQSPDEPREAEIARAMFEGWDLPATLVSVDQARAEGWTVPPLAPGESPAGRHVDGSWAVPHLAGRPFLEKPPLYYWAVCACFAVCGVNEFSARLPDALCGFLTCVLIYAMVRRWRDGPTALLAALLLATMHRFWEFSHTAMIDMVLTCCTTLAYYAYARWSDGFFTETGQGGESGGAGETGSAVPESPTSAPTMSFRQQLGWSALFWTAVGLAFLAKNMIGPILILGGCGVHLLYACMFGKRRGTIVLTALQAILLMACTLGLKPVLVLYLQPEAIQNLFLAIAAVDLAAILFLFALPSTRRWVDSLVSLGVGLPLLAVTCGPWLWALHASEGNEGLYELLWLNTFGRMNEAYGGHNINNPFFYVDNFFLLGAPWTFFLPLGAVWGAWRWGAKTTSAAMRSRGVFLACWLIVPTVLLSLSAGKRGVYLLPIQPGQAAAVAWLLAAGGAFVPGWLDTLRRWYMRAAMAVVIASLAGALLFALGPDRLDEFYNSLKIRRGMPRMDFPGPQWLYLPFGLAGLAVALAAAFHPRARTAVPVLRWVGFGAAVGMFFLGVTVGGLLDFVFQHKVLDPYCETCERYTADHDLYLLYPGEKEKGYLAWSTRGKGVYETLGMQESVSIRTGMQIAFADAVQERIARGRPAVFLLPESSLGQFGQPLPVRQAGATSPDDSPEELPPVSFPTWPRHLYPVAVTAINDNWYWVLQSRLAVDAYSARVRQARSVQVLVHPAQAGFVFTKEGRILPHLWGGAEILEALRQSPDLCLIVPDDPVTGPSAEPPILPRIRSEWPVFDERFIEVDLVRTGADLDRYTGDSPLAGPTLHIFVPRTPVSSP